jgi:hypothetical protein
LVFSVETVFSMQLGRPQEKIHASVSDVPWHNSQVIRSLQLQAER